MDHFYTWPCNRPVGWVKNLSGRVLHEQASLIFVATMFSLWIKNCLWVENLFLILLKEGDRESAAPPLMPSESETKRNGFIITSSFVDLKTMNSYRLPGKYLHLTPQQFQKHKINDLNFWSPLSMASTWGPRGEVSACRKRRRTWRGSGRLRIWCCSRRPSDGAGQSHLGRPPNCPFPGLSNLLREKYFCMRVRGGQKCCCFNFGSWQGRLDEEMTLDVSDGPALARFDGWCKRSIKFTLYVLDM